MHEQHKSEAACAAPRVRGDAMRETGPSGPSGDEGGGAACRSSGQWLQLGHELRTPLNAILGNVELLLDGSAGPVSAQARACLSDVQSAGRQLLEQVKLLLLWLRASTGSPAAAEARVDLLLLLRRALARARPAAAAWDVAPADARLVVQGDPLGLQVLAEAVAEAVRARAPQDHGGGLAIEASLDGGIGGVRCRIGWSGFDAGRLPPISLVLIDAVLRKHGGRVCLVAGRGLDLYWPAARVIVG